MKRFVSSEIGAAIAWIFASLVIAAAIAPWLYQGGKHLAYQATMNQLPPTVEWIANSCGRAKLGRYFDRGLLAAALCLFPILWLRLKKICNQRQSEHPYPLRSLHSSNAASQVVIAFFIAASILWLMGLGLHFAGAYGPVSIIPSTAQIISKVVTPAVGAAFIEEWLFRGILLGLWLHFARPLHACIGSALLFSFLHFLDAPKSIGNPSHYLAGFELLASTLQHFVRPQFFLTDFATLTVVGLILAWARIQTGSLWFGIGLHAGWIFSLKAFGLFYMHLPHHSLSTWAISENLRSGIIPLLTLCLTAGICHFLFKYLATQDRNHKNSAKTRAF